VSRSCDKAAIELLQFASSMRASCTSQSLNGVVVEPRLAATLALHLSRLQLTAFSEWLGRCCPLHVIFVLSFEMRAHVRTRAQMHVHIWVFAALR